MKVIDRLNCCEPGFKSYFKPHLTLEYIFKYLKIRQLFQCGSSTENEQLLGPCNSGRNYIAVYNLQKLKS